MTSIALSRRGHRAAPIIVAALAAIALIVAPVSAANAGKATVSLTATLSASTVHYAKSVTVSGTVKISKRAASGVTVKIVGKASTSKKWKTLAAVRSTANGKYSYTFMPKTGFAIKAKVSSGSGHKSAKTSAKSLKVKPLIAAISVSGTARSAVGAARTITGSVNKAQAKNKVQVERFTGKKWQVAATSKVTSTGAFSLKVRTTEYGSRGYRVTLPAADGLIAASSARITVDSYGSVIDRYADKRDCWGASAFATADCTNPALGTSITPSIVGKAYEKDNVGAYRCYATDSKKPIPTCTFGSTRTDALRVAIVGDSHAGMMVAGVLDRLGDLNWKLDTFTGRGCIVTTGDASDPCVGRHDSAQARLLAGSYDLVLVTAVRSANPAAPATDPAIQRYTDDWTALVNGGATVVALKDNPAISTTALACIDASAAYADASECSVSTAEAFALADPQKAAAAAVPGVEYVDLSSLQCADGECPLIVGHVMGYRDTHHLTTTFSKSLMPYLIDRAVGRL